MGGPMGPMSGPMGPPMGGTQFSYILFCLDVVNNCGRAKTIYIIDAAIQASVVVVDFVVVAVAVDDFSEELAKEIVMIPTTM